MPDTNRDAAYLLIVNALCNAVVLDRIDELKQLLENRDISSYINGQDFYTNTPLHYAAYNNNLDIVKLLLAADADVHL